MKNNLPAKEILIYTDGSCHTQKRTGAWVAIVLYDRQEIILQGTETNTTHNRMELLAVIKGIEYVDNILSGDYLLQIFTDSQYVINLPARSAKLTTENFITKKGNELPNHDLLNILFPHFENPLIHFNKIRAHQQQNETNRYNIMADKLSRSMVRAMSDE